MPSALTLTTHSPEETQRLGRLLGEQAQPGDLFLFSGPLGVGKTTLIQGIAFGLGVKEYARSPTFVLVTQYRGRLPLYHMDLFRVDNPLEVLDLGLDEYLESGGVCVIEWAERAEELFPWECLWVHMEYGEGQADRRIRLEARGERYQGLVASLERPLGTYRKEAKEG